MHNICNDRLASVIDTVINVNLTVMTVMTSETQLSGGRVVQEVVAGLRDRIRASYGILRRTDVTDTGQKPGTLFRSCA